MKTPTELELSHLMGVYDPIKAHEYYLRTRKLTGRKKPEASESHPSMGTLRGRMDPRTGKTKEQIHQGAKARQKKELTERINALSKKVDRLEARIKEMEHKAASEDRKGKAQKERSAKERDKPKTAAEKAEAARESEKYRDKHRQELKSKAKGKSGGGSSTGKGQAKKRSVSELKNLVAKAKGQIAVAKQKLAAL